MSQFQGTLAKFHPINCFSRNKPSPPRCTCWFMTNFKLFLSLPCKCSRAVQINGSSLTKWWQWWWLQTVVWKKRIFFLYCAVLSEQNKYIFIYMYMHGSFGQKRGLQMTNRAARTEQLVMEVLMTMLLKGYFWVVFSFSLTSTPWCLHQRVHFASYYLPLFLHNLECSCSGGQIKVWWNQMRMKRIMKEKWRRRAGSAEEKVLNQRASAQQDCGLYRPVVRRRCGGCRMEASEHHLITHLKKKKIREKVGVKYMPAPTVSHNWFYETC